VQHATSSTAVGPFDKRLDAWFAADSEALANGHLLWEEMRDAAPVYQYGATTIVTPHDLVKDIVQDPERLSNDHSRRGSRAEAAFARLTTDEQRHAFRQVMDFESHFMNRNDGEEHRRLRGAAAGAMTPRRIEQVTAAIDRHADAALEALGDQPIVDFKKFSLELPLRVICDLIGVPDEDRLRIAEWATALSGNRHGTNPDALVPAYEAWCEFREYVELLVERYRDSVEGSDQLVTLLMAAHEEDRLSLDEVVSLFVMMLQGGHETTSNLLSIGLYEMLQWPGQWDALVEDQSLIPNAVEEMLRMVSPAQTASRRCVTEMEIGGRPIQPQGTVLALLAAANRDPAVFDDPQHFDVRRTDARRHLPLSFGPHFCLGSSLARAETATALRKLTHRFPKLELAADDVRFQGPWQLRRIVELPVATGA
jgi:cytochrome P450